MAFEATYAYWDLAQAVEETLAYLLDLGVLPHWRNVSHQDFFLIMRCLLITQG